tara:strand:- start:2515 stop:3690 length:1176 start_codon:yes stop_codon:yes gene_type:complete
MTIDEMHIGVQHGVDKINSMHSDVLLPEEIDLELNKNILRFINTRFNPRGNRYQKGFEMSQKRIDDLRTLVIEQSIPTAYKGHVFDNTWVDAAFLPSDYLYLINVKSLVRSNKCKDFCHTVAVAQMKPLAFILNVNLTMHVTPSGGLPATFTSPANAYIGYESLGQSNAPLLTQVTKKYPGASGSTAQLKSFFTNSSNWLFPGVSITDMGGTLLKVEMPIGNTTQFDYLGIVWYDNTSAAGVDHPGQTDDAGGNSHPHTASGIFSSSSFWGEKRYPCDDDFTHTVGINEFAQHDDIYTVLQDPFNKTTYKSPLFTIKEDYIEVYTDNTFIINDIKVTYLKQPAEVNAGNNIDCDLPQHTHQEIVDMTVATILEGLSDPRYQSSNMELLKSE